MKKEREAIEYHLQMMDMALHHLDAVMTKSCSNMTNRTAAICLLRMGETMIEVCTDSLQGCRNELQAIKASES